LVIDPVISNKRFSKVLMDGGNSLNILYAHTLRLLGIGLDQLRHAMESASSPSGRSICRSGSARQTTSARRHSPSRWWGSGARSTPFLGSRATPSSWRSQTTPTSR
jgi:hypothetical protein